MTDDLDAALAAIELREQAEQAKRATKAIERTGPDAAHATLMKAIGKAEREHRLATERVEISVFEC